MVAILEEIAVGYDGIVARAKEVSEAAKELGAKELGFDPSEVRSRYIKGQLDEIAQRYGAHSIDYNPGSEATLYFEMDKVPTKEMLLKSQSTMNGLGGTLMLGDFSFWKDHEDIPDGYVIYSRILRHLLVASIPMNPTEIKSTEISDVASEQELPTNAQVEISSLYRTHPHGHGYVAAVKVPMKDSPFTFFFEETIGTMLGLFGYKVPEKQISPVNH